MSSRQSFKRQRECSFAIVINGRTYAAFIHLSDAVDWAEHRYSTYKPEQRHMIQIIDSYGDEFHKHAWPRTVTETLPRGDDMTVREG